jgi:hypothetical protein
MMAGPLITLWSIRVACVLYFISIAAWITRKTESMRMVWTIAFIFYLVHVAAAFHSYHHWSHDAAYEETARQTAELFGMRWGGGLYFNYLFTVVWAGDVLWIWLDPAGHRRRPRWISAAIQTFLAFMFFNATVVFAEGWVRWLAVILTAGLGLLWLRTSKHILEK